MKQTAMTINMINNNSNSNEGEQLMTSIEIAQLTGKRHFDVLKAIRKMEPAWEKVQGSKFACLQKIYDLPNGGKKMTPYFSLTKTELYSFISFEILNMSRMYQMRTPIIVRINKAIKRILGSSDISIIT